MSAQIALVQENLNIINIPLDLYNAFLEPILRILLPHGDSLSLELLESLPDNHHNFLNISITPIECCVICHVSWAQKIFLPFVNEVSGKGNNKAQIYSETYTAFSMSTVNMDAGKRVIDLTAPLAIAGIPIFFITTCYTDFFLVPSKDRSVVVSILLERGFGFSDEESAYIPTSFYESHKSGLPSTPVPLAVSELQDCAFSLLKKRNVIPFVEPDLQLVMCSGNKIPPREFGYHSEYGKANPESSHLASTWLSSTNSALYVGAISVLIRRPHLFSITLALDDMPSLLIDRKMLRIFGNSVTGDFKTILMPIFLNLSAIPIESTGIVCGVASLLVRELSNIEGDKEFVLTELSYLSTFRAGTVILSEDQSRKALGALLPMLEEKDHMLNQKKNLNFNQTYSA